MSIILTNLNFILRYVDDILAAFDKEQDSLNFLNFLNKKHLLNHLLKKKLLLNLDGSPQPLYFKGQSYSHFPETKNTGLVSSGVSLTSWGGASLALVGHPSSDGVTMKMPYGVDVLHRPALHPIFSYWVG